MIFGVTKEVLYQAMMRLPWEVQNAGVLQGLVVVDRCPASAEGVYPLLQRRIHFVKVKVIGPRREHNVSVLPWWLGVRYLQ